MGLFGPSIIKLEIGDELAGVIKQALGMQQGNNKEILRRLNKIMASQEEFDAQIAEANSKLDGLAEAVAAEAKQISDFIASQPAAVDTSALAGVVERLGGVSASVSGIFEPAPSEDPAPAEEPEA